MSFCFSVNVFRKVSPRKNREIQLLWIFLSIWRICGKTSPRTIQILNRPNKIPFRLPLTVEFRPQKIERFLNERNLKTKVFLDFFDFFNQVSFLFSGSYIYKWLKYSNNIRMRLQWFTYSFHCNQIFFNRFVRDIIQDRVFLAIIFCFVKL